MLLLSAHTKEREIEMMVERSKDKERVLQVISCMLKLPAERAVLLGQSIQICHLLNCNLFCSSLTALMLFCLIPFFTFNVPAPPHLVCLCFFNYQAFWSFHSLSSFFSNYSCSFFAYFSSTFYQSFYQLLLITEPRFLCEYKCKKL